MTYGITLGNLCVLVPYFFSWLPWTCWHSGNQNESGPGPALTISRQVRLVRKSWCHDVTHCKAQTKVHSPNLFLYTASLHPEEGGNLFWLGWPGRPLQVLEQAPASRCEWADEIALHISSCGSCPHYPGGRWGIKTVLSIGQMHSDVLKIFCLIVVSLDHTMVVDVEIVHGKILFTTLGVLPCLAMSCQWTAQPLRVNQDLFVLCLIISFKNSRTSHHHPCPTQFFHVFSDDLRHPQTPLQAPLPPRLDTAFHLALRALRAQRDTSPAPATWTGRPVAEYLAEDAKRRHGAVEQLEKAIGVVEDDYFVMIWGLGVGISDENHCEDCYELVFVHQISWRKSKGPIKLLVFMQFLKKNIDDSCKKNWCSIIQYP